MKKWVIFIRVNDFMESCRLIEGRYLVGDTASKKGFARCSVAIPCKSTDWIKQCVLSKWLIQYN